MDTPTRKSDTARNLRHQLGIEAGLGRLREEPDPAEHVVQMMRQVLLTDFGERPMRPEFGAGLRGLVFEPLRGASEALVRAGVIAALRTWLDDVIRVDSVTVSVAEETLAVRIIYALRTEPGRRILNLETPV